MVTERLKIHGVIRGGVIVPDAELTLPEGTEVEISFFPTELPQESQDELSAWDRASDDEIVDLELTHALMRLSEPAFTKVCDNDEDAVYDDL